MKRYAIIEKAVGETPLAALERYRLTDPALSGVPLAYAGRLDPMACGKLLVLIGEECKQQRKYHALDKAYTFEILFGVGSDTGDVLGLLTWDEKPPEITYKHIAGITKKISGSALTLPYPAFSSKTVQGKPLHIWTLEKRLDEITIPSATTTIYALACTGITKHKAHDLASYSLEKIGTIPTVTEASKRLGADFRRNDVRASWKEFDENDRGSEYTVATFTCICSSGTYIRSLTEYMGTLLATQALALSIRRTEIGSYKKLPFGMGFWSKTY